MSSKQGFFGRIGRALIEGMERNAQRQTRQYLLGLSDEFLVEMGISRKLLAQGPDAWPWRIDGEAQEALSQSTLNALKVSKAPVPAANDRGAKDKLAA